MPLLVDAAVASIRRARSRNASVLGIRSGMQLGAHPVRAHCRIGREGALVAFERLRPFAAGWHEIEPTEIVRETAIRFLRVHPLCAADVLQLAAAFAAAEHRPASLQVVTLDERLASAARKEGFALVDFTGTGAPKDAI